MVEKRRKVYISRGYTPEFVEVRRTIDSVLYKLQSARDIIFSTFTSLQEAEALRQTDKTSQGAIIESTRLLIAFADIVIIDISNDDPIAVYELGFAHALNKWTVVLKQPTEGSKLDLPSQLWISYNKPLSIENLAISLEMALAPSLDGQMKPAVYMNQQISDLDTKKQIVFISFHPSDRQYHDELRASLKPAENPTLEVCSEQDIAMGTEIIPQLEAKITKAGVAIILVSQSYINSEPHMGQLTKCLDEVSKRGMKLIPLFIDPFNEDGDIKSLFKYKPANDKDIEYLAKLNSDAEKHKRQEIYRNITTEIKRAFGLSNEA